MKFKRQSQLQTIVLLVWLLTRAILLKHCVKKTKEILRTYRINVRTKLIHQQEYINSQQRLIESQKQTLQKVSKSLLDGHNFLKSITNKLEEAKEKNMEQIHINDMLEALQSLQTAFPRPK